MLPTNNVHVSYRLGEEQVSWDGTLRTCVALVSGQARLLPRRFLRVLDSDPRARGRDQRGSFIRLAGRGSSADALHFPNICRRRGLRYGRDRRLRNRGASRSLGHDAVVVGVSSRRVGDLLLLSSIPAGCCGWGRAWRLESSTLPRSATKSYFMSKRTRKQARRRIKEASIHLFFQSGRRREWKDAPGVTVTDDLG
jgi:hypothetical protein